MRAGWIAAVVGVMALCATVYSVASSPGAVASGSEAATGKERLFVPGVVRTYSTPAPTSTPTPTPTATPIPEVPDCTDLLVHVSKSVSLASDCVPPNLQDIPARFAAVSSSLQVRGDALPSLIQMLDTAAGNGHYLYVSSAYRSYQEQDWLFWYWVSVLGEDEAYRTSALPGHSEHQVGTVVDLTSSSVAMDLVEAFGGTPEGQWLAQYSWLYGWVMSYPANTESITGYAYEPWHFRYVGLEVAKEIHDKGWTLHDYLGRR